MIRAFFLSSKSEYVLSEDNAIDSWQRYFCVSVQKENLLD